MASNIAPTATTAQSIEFDNFNPSLIVPANTPIEKKDPLGKPAGWAVPIKYDYPNGKADRIRIKLYKSGPNLENYLFPFSVSAKENGYAQLRVRFLDSNPYAVEVADALENAITGAMINYMLEQNNARFLISKGLVQEKHLNFQKMKEDVVQQIFWRPPNEQYRILTLRLFDGSTFKIPIAETSTSTDLEGNEVTKTNAKLVPVGHQYMQGTRGQGLIIAELDDFYFAHNAKKTRWHMYNTAVETWSKSGEYSGPSAVDSDLQRLINSRGDSLLLENTKKVEGTDYEKSAPIFKRKMIKKEDGPMGGSGMVAGASAGMPPMNAGMPLQMQQMMAAYQGAGAQNPYGGAPAGPAGGFNAPPQMNPFQNQFMQPQMFGQQPTGQLGMLSSRPPMGGN